MISIIRRFDLDADAKLNKKEFIEGVKPSADDFSKRAIKEQKSFAQSGISTNSRVLSPRGGNQHSAMKSQRSQSRSHTADITSPYARGKSSNKKASLLKSGKK